MKKVLAGIITLTMLFTLAIPRSVYARAEQKIKLADAIETSKNLLGINTDNYNFNYNYNEGSDGHGFWQLSWSSKKTNGENINVAINSETGEIQSYNFWQPYIGQTTARIPKYSKDAAFEAAVNFLNKIIPLKYKDTVLKDNSDMQAYMPVFTDAYNFSFIRQVNGLDFPNNSINISIDKNTLSVKSYGLNWDNGPFPDPSKAIDQENAKKIFENKLGLELSYRLITDYNAKTETPILVYSLKGGNNSIDALTGEVLTNGLMYGESANMDMKAAATGAMPNLTPEEQKSVDSSDKYVSKDIALSEAKKYLPIDENTKLNGANLFINEFDKSASWNFYWDKSDSAKRIYNYMSATVDALTGKMKSFSMSGSDFYPDKETPVKYTKDQAREIAEKFINNLEPDKFKITTLKNDSYANIPNSAQATDYSFNYAAKINGAACDFDYFTININAFTGAVMSYNMAWKNISLPATNGAISLQDAYNFLYKKAKLNLKYISLYNYEPTKTPTSQIKLSYVLDNFSGMLDAHSGVFLDSLGKPVVEKKNSSYSDIKNNPSENDINILVDLGIIDDNESTYRPNDKILQKDFIKLLVKSQSPDYVTYNKDSQTGDEAYNSYYNTAVQKKIITEDQKNPNSLVTRQEAARFIVKAMGIGYLGKLSGIFKLPFTDASLIPSEYKGYAAVAAGLNIINPISSTFSGAKALTRGESASIIVNYLKLDTNQ